MKNQTEDLLIKKKGALCIINCFTYFAEILMYSYAGLFIYSFISTPKTMSVIASLGLNLSLILGAAIGCEICRKYLKKKPPKYREAQITFGFTICLILTFVMFYAISAAAIYFLVNGVMSWLVALIILCFIFPHLVLGLSGLCVIKNFNTLFVEPIKASQALSSQYQVGSSINNSVALNGGFMKAPEVFRQSHGQGMTKDQWLSSPND